MGFRWKKGTQKILIYCPRLKQSRLYQKVIEVFDTVRQNFHENVLTQNLAVGKAQTLPLGKIDRSSSFRFAENVWTVISVLVWNRVDRVVKWRKSSINQQNSLANLVGDELFFRKCLNAYLFGPAHLWAEYWLLALEVANEFAKLNQKFKKHLQVMLLF